MWTASGQWLSDMGVHEAVCLKGTPIHTPDLWDPAEAALQLRKSLRLLNVLPLPCPVTLILPLRALPAQITLRLRMQRRASQTFFQYRPPKEPFPNRPTIILQYCRYTVYPFTYYCICAFYTKRTFLSPVTHSVLLEVLLHPPRMLLRENLTSQRGCASVPDT